MAVYVVRQRRPLIEQETTRRAVRGPIDKQEVYFGNAPTTTPAPPPLRP
jgi:hypothetical protein